MLVIDEYPEIDETDDAPIPAAEVSLSVVARDGRTYATRSRLGGHPSIIYPRIGKAGLAWMRQVLSSERLRSDPVNESAR